MKKALPLAAVFISAATIGQAQITKGKILLGGTVAYSQSAGYSSDKSFVISPSFGKVIKENLILGVEASVGYGIQKYGAQAIPLKNKYQSYGGAVFLRRYVPLLKNFYFFGQGTADANKSRGRQTSNGQVNYSTEGWGAAVSLNPGLTYAITKKLYVESGMNGFALLAYSRFRTENTDSNTGAVTVSKISNFNFSTSLGSSGGINIGFRLLL